LVKKTRKNTKKSKKTTKRKSKKLNKVIFWGKCIGIGIACFLLYLVFCIITIPDMDEAINRTRLPSTTILAENGNEVQSFGTVYSEIVRAEELPQYVIDAIVYTEDKRFYKHFVKSTKYNHPAKRQGERLGWFLFGNGLKTLFKICL
jgi:membrane peptidoglycan carboxypeptidase